MREFLAGALLAVVLTLASAPIQAWLWPPDPDDWLFVDSVSVPNFSLSNYELVELEYVREVRVPFAGRYHVKAIMLNEDGTEEPAAVCLGTDDFPYTIHPQADMFMSVRRFIGPLRPDDHPNCFTEPGLYRLYVQWEMYHDKTGDRRVQRHISNIFRVTE